MPRRKAKSTTTHVPEVRAALDAFRHIVQALRPNADGAARVSGARLFALQQIADHPDASVNDIAGLTFTHQSSVSVVIQRLVEAGLVAKLTSDTDRRRFRLAVTAKGRRALERAPTTAQERLIAAIAELSVADRKTLARLLRAVAGSVTPAGSRAHPPMFFEGGA